MKKIISLIAAIFCIFAVAAISGCSDNAPDPVEVSVSDEYIFEQDCPTFITNNTYVALTKAPNGYYYFSDTNKLTLFDTNLKKSTIVCDKADCAHNDDSCPAYFGFNMSKHYSSMHLQYYNGSLYTFYSETDKDNVINHYIARVSLDGREKEKKCFLFKSIGEADCNIFIHRGCVYFDRMEYSGDMQAVKLYKTGLEAGNSKPQEIFSYTGRDPYFKDLQFFGNHLYFTYNSDDAATNGVILNDYDIRSGSVSEIKLNNFSGLFAVSGREIYYYDNTAREFVKYDLDLKTYTSFYKGENGRISIDGEKLYIDISTDTQQNGLTHKVLAVDLKTKETTEYSFNKEYSICRFGGSDYLIFEYPDPSTRKTEFEFIEKQ